MSRRIYTRLILAPAHRSIRSLCGQVTQVVCTPVGASLMRPRVAKDALDPLFPRHRGAEELAAHEAADVLAG
ncbi:unnamed protein product [Boreogadus saida]